MLVQIPHDNGVLTAMGGHDGIKLVREEGEGGAVLPAVFSARRRKNIASLPM